jgi:hypothetical protein
VEPVRFESLEEGQRWLERLEDEYEERRDYLEECTFSYYKFGRRVNTSNKMYGKVTPLFRDEATKKLDWALYTKRRPSSKKGAKSA